MATRPITKGFSENEWQLREEIVERCRELNERGINQGTSGNISARCGEGFLISPSGFPYELMQPEHIVPMWLDGSHAGKLKPSSEWRFHQAIYQRRAEAEVIVHTHSPEATALACMGRALPPIHYMIGLLGGDPLDAGPRGVDRLEQRVQARRRRHEGAVAEGAHQRLCGVRQGFQLAEPKHSRSALEGVQHPENVRQALAIAWVVLERDEVQVEPLQILAALLDEIADDFSKCRIDHLAQLP